MIKPTRTKAEIGKTNLTKSKIGERLLVNYYRAHGWPGAERTVRTGYRSGQRAGRDHGDIDGTPGLATQLKITGKNPDPQVPQWLAEVDDQRLAAGADVGLLVVKRLGTTDPGRWWAYLRLDALAALLGSMASESAAAPVRLDLATVVALLRANGYGSPESDMPPAGEVSA